MGEAGITTEFWSEPLKEGTSWEFWVSQQGNIKMKHEDMEYEIIIVHFV
jgi:hypothetical protein